MQRGDAADEDRVAEPAAKVAWEPVAPARAAWAETVRTEAFRHLPYLVVLPVVSVWAFLFDGVFIGATRTAVMRDGMILAFVVFAASAAALVPALGSHGLWTAFLAFMAWRGAWLGIAYLRIEAGSAGFAGART